MPNVRSVKYTIGHEDAGTPGTPVARTVVLPVSDIGDLDRIPAKAIDPAINGSGMKTGDYVASASVEGSLPLAPRACAGFGMALLGAFGTEAAPAQLAGIVAMRYTGASASCKITTSLAGKTVVSAIGALGAESGDAAFGTAGSIDLTAAGFDTLTELTAAIEAYADYEAVLISGTDASTITSVVGGTYQAKNGWVYLFFTGATSGAYLHAFTPNLTVDSERPTFSIQQDGMGDNYLYDGCIFDELSVSGALKGAIEASVSVIGFDEAVGQEASTVALEDRRAFIFGYGRTTIAGDVFDYVRSHSFKTAAGHSKDGYGQSSLNRAYHQKGDFACTGEMNLRMNATAYAERAKVALGTQTKITLVYYSSEKAAIGGGVYEMMIVQIPYAKIQSFKKNEKNGDQIDCSLTFEAFYPAGTLYELPMTVYIVTDDSAAY